MGVTMKKRITIIIIITFIIAVIALLLSISDNNIFKHQTAEVVFSNNENIANSENRDNIYFFHKGYNDCILIESDGHYGLVDTSNRYSQTITDSNGTKYSITPSGYFTGEMLADITYEGSYYNSSGALIDNTAPEITVAYSTTALTSQNVIVTLTANEVLQEVEGWTLSADKKTLTKEYSENKTEEITLKDLVGNSSNVTIEITNIEKTGTGMTGIEVTNWMSLKNEIENTGKTNLVINLTNNESNNWIVDSKITISSEQNVRLVVKGNIIAKRSEGFLDSFIENNGTLEIVPENESIYLTFDGNKEIVANSTGSLIEVYNGYLNMKNMILRNNKKVASGGGMYVKGSQMIFDNVQISDNEGKGGGGIIILNNNSDTQFNNVIINNNNAISSSGGGIYAYGKLKITGEGTRISNNTAKTLGGGIMVKNECTIKDGEISGNVATENAGGGIRVDGKLTLNGGCIKNNSANIGGGGIDYNSGMFFYNNGTVENNQSNNASNYKFPNADIYPDLKYNVDWTQDESLNIYRIKPSVMKSYIRGTDIVDRSTQGMTRTDKYIIFTSWKTNEDDTILNIVDRESLSVLNSIGGFQFKHANGMTYNSKTGYVYILPTTKNLVKFKINDETYEIEDLSYIECTRIYSGIAYDKDDDCYIAYADGKIYILDSNYNEINSFDLIMQLTAQEVAYYNGHIYFMSFEAGNNSSHQVHSFNNKERLSSLIYEYDIEGNLIRSLYISREDFAGELESGYFEENGDFVVSYNITFNNKSTVSLLKSDVFSPDVTVEYSEANKTNQNVTATITANEEIQGIEGWTLSTDKKQLTKEYSENKTEEVTIKDLAGNSTNATIEIKNIDKTAPTVNVKYSTTNLTNGNVTVTITANEEVQSVVGWTLSNDKNTITKTYQSNAEENVQLKDIAGNIANTKISIKNIDKEKPVITGIENGIVYKDSVTTTATDANPGTLLLEKDGTKVEGYTNGKEIIEEGAYKLTATDKVGNTTIVNFTIKYTRGEVNGNNQIDIGDVLLLLRHIAQSNSEKTQQKHPDWKLSNKKVIIGDFNRNNKIDIGDVLKLQRYMAAKASKSVSNKHPDWLNIE